MSSTSPEARDRVRCRSLVFGSLTAMLAPVDVAAQAVEDAASRQRTRPDRVDSDGAPGQGGAPGLEGARPSDTGRGRAVGAPPAWIPYATAAAFLAHERSAQRGLGVDADGATVSEVQGAEAETAGVGAELGLRWTGERSTARLTYVFGLALRDDEDTGWQSVTHGLRAEGERQATDRVAVRAGVGTFLGLRDSRTVLGGVGLGAGTEAPGGAPDAGGAAETGTDRRLLARIPYLRQDAGAGLTLATSETVRHRFGVAGTALLYPDREVVRDSGERLFETLTIGPEYGLEWGATERDTVQLGATAATTWFVPVFRTPDPTGGAAPPATEPTALAPVQTVGAQVGWTRRLSTTWTLRGHVGAGVVWPLDSGDEASEAQSDSLDTGASATLLGGLGTQWRRGRWQLGVETGREVAQSEVGAVYATTTARAEGRRRLTEVVDVALRGGVARYDVLTQVFASDEDLAAFAAAPDGQTDREALVARARRAQEGYGVEAGALANWRLSPIAAVSFTYAMEQRISDDRDRGDRLVHRGILGLTLASMIGGQSALPVGGDEE